MGKLNFRPLANHISSESSYEPKPPPTPSPLPRKLTVTKPAVRVFRKRIVTKPVVPLPSNMSSLPPLTQIPTDQPVPPQQTTEAVPVVIGVMVLDTNAVPNYSMPAANHTRPSASPGKITKVLGGVARNVADCMSKLKAKPFLISAVGLDVPGKSLYEHWESTRLSVQGILRLQDIETAVSCNVFDGKGGLVAAVACVDSIDKFLTPKWIEKFKSKIRSAPILMVDANLSSHSLEASCRMAAQFTTPVWFDPVSVARSRRIASVVHYVRFVSANEDELIAMANALSRRGRDRFSPVQRDLCSTVESLFEMLKPAISCLLDNGVKVIVVTVGQDGVFLCSKAKSVLLQKLDFKGNRLPSSSKQLREAVDAECSSGRFYGASRYGLYSDFYAVHFPALSASVVRLTGAGDCLVGGTIASLSAGLDVMQSVAVGIAAAKFAVEVETNVPAETCLDGIEYDASHVYSGMSVSQSRDGLGNGKNVSFGSFPIQPPQNKSNNPLLTQSQSENIADAPGSNQDESLIGRSAYQSRQVVRPIGKQMTGNLTRNLTDQQPISVMKQPNPSSLPNAGLIPSQDKGPELKLTYTKIVTSNLPPEEKPKDGEITETIQ
ncbi:pseudouridine kinase isoform X2 [Nicotiana tabacum]|nr:PREDICTED: uncharacterized protein LOC107832316 isoform X2 [Nicotiana tabacum]XP_016515618.1 PREDICTED: uncharacterized protein LOC107832316 isoform X2 [Nicotiana tabacum]